MMEHGMAAYTNERLRNVGPQSGTPASGRHD
jgi:hypothetical protein